MLLLMCYLRLYVYENPNIAYLAASLLVALINLPKREW